MIKIDRRYVKKLLIFSLITAMVVLGVYYFLIKPNFLLAVNESDSLPETFFLVVKNHQVFGKENEKKKRFDRGDVVAFFPPKNNPLYGEKYPFLKKIGGVPGDVVSRKGRSFFVNGVFMGFAYKRAHNGEELKVGPTGVLDQGEYYVYTANPKSYDSRYQSIGWIKENEIVGKAYPLF